MAKKDDDKPNKKLSYLFFLIFLDSMNNKVTLCKKRMLNKISIKRLSLYKKKLGNKVVVIKVWMKSLLSSNSLKCRGK